MQPGVYVPVSKEYVIDIDISDYDNVRFCGCQGAKFCDKCWPLMSCGMKALDHLLDQCFGFDHRLWVYSGRRGVHCWISDDVARNLDNESRSAVTNFLHIYVGNDKSGYKLTYDLRYPHPTFGLDSDLYRICESYFISIYCLEESMDIFNSKDRWSQLVNLLDNDAQAAIRTCIESSLSETNATGEEIWDQIKETLKERNRASYIPYIVYSFVYPRLDANVSKQLNHLRKSPFCVHPSTEYICVPMNSYEFYPEKDCPNVRELTEGSEKDAKLWRKAMKCFEAHLDNLWKKQQQQAKIKKQESEHEKMDIDF